MNTRRCQQVATRNSPAGQRDAFSKCRNQIVLVRNPDSSGQSILSDQIRLTARRNGRNMGRTSGGGGGSRQSKTFEGDNLSKGVPHPNLAQNCVVIEAEPEPRVVVMSMCICIGVLFVHERICEIL